MQSFEDNTGRKWQVAVTVDAVKRVRNLTEVDLLTRSADCSTDSIASTRPAPAPREDRAWGWLLPSRLPYGMEAIFG